MEAKPENKVVSAREVIVSYTRGDLQAVLTYKKICTAFELVGKWSPEAAKQFLLQMLDISSVIDHTCKTLVQNIAKLRWKLVPEDMRERWRNLLVEIGVGHVIYLETIYQAAIANLAPEVVTDEAGVESYTMPKDEQEDLFGMAHSIVSQLLLCVPVSAKLVRKRIVSATPHHSAPTLRWTVYIRNLINVSEYAGDLREFIWKHIVDHFITLDTLIGRPDDGNDSGTEIFHMDEEKHGAVEWENETKERAAKLNISMKHVMEYLKGAHEYEVDKEDTEWMHCTGDHAESVFAALQNAFTADLLITPNARFVSFLWLFLGSLRPDYPSRILASLWEVLIRPSSIHGEVKRSQGAASYLAAFMARARYVDVKMTHEYLTNMASYLSSYVERVGLSSRTVIPGLAHHGVFYAMANAFFLAFAFRYKDLVKNDLMSEVRHWSIGRIVNSSLDPLKYSLDPVARCFSAVSRSLQLVYCSHILPLPANDVRRPFEPCFPFDAYSLDKSLSLITPLTRKFSPMREHSESLKLELEMGARGRRAEEDDEGTLDFLDDVDDEMQYGSSKPAGYSGPIGVVSGAARLTVYSTSPGLRPFVAGSPMDTR